MPAVTNSHDLSAPVSIRIFVTGVPPMPVSPDNATFFAGSASNDH